MKDFSVTASHVAVAVLLLGHAVFTSRCPTPHPFPLITDVHACVQNPGKKYNFQDSSEHSVPMDEIFAEHWTKIRKSHGLENGENVNLPGLPFISL